MIGPLRKTLGVGSAVRCAFAALLSLPSAGQTIDRLLPLIDALEAKVVSKRQEAAFLLGETGPEARAAIPALVNALGDKDMEVRGLVTMALTKISPESIAKPQVIVAALLQEDSAVVRSSLAHLLGQMGPVATPVVPILVTALEDRRYDNRLRESAARSLSEMGPAAASALPARMKILRSKDEDIGLRGEVVGALGGIKTMGAEVVPVLLDALVEEDLRDCCCKGPRAVGSRTRTGRRPFGAHRRA